MDGKRLLRTATAVAAATAVTGASPAAAGACPPEETVAALDQYCESLPTPLGAGAPMAAGPDGGKSRPLSAMLSPAQAERLRKAGPEARALLMLPAFSPLARAPMTRAQRRREESGARTPASARGAPAEGDIGRVAAGMGSAAGDVVSGAFRWGLVICSLGLAGMTWLRLRSRLKL